MKHTPGPWKVKGVTPSLKITANGSTVATIIATSKADAETKEANAVLISLSPEMLAAIQIALPILNAHKKDIERRLLFPVPEEGRLMVAIKAMSSIIAKLEGVS